MRRHRPHARGRGYNLVALMVLVAVINITVAAALPSLSQAMRREREAELVFRGLQYAEAIRVFQLRNGRYPTSLRELLETNPRCIRQLWTDPFNDDGEWGLILAAQGSGATGRELGFGGDEVDEDGDGDGDEDEDEEGSEGPGARARMPRRRGRQPSPKEVQPREKVTELRRIPRRGQVVSRGPIIGVTSLSDEESVRSFMGSQKYSDWDFTADLIPTLEVTALGENVPRLHTLWIGRSFPEGLEGVEAGPVTPERLRNKQLRNPLDQQRSRGRQKRNRPGRRRND